MAKSRKAYYREYHATHVDDRTRNWSFFVYPDSAPGNWREILDEEHIQWVESPLHDKDVDPDGEVKKAHWHVLLMYEGKKSFAQIKAITDKLNQPIPQKAASAIGLVRYMAHLDNPEKFQYDRSLIVGHGGADVARYLKPTTALMDELVGEMMDYIESAGVTEVRALMRYAKDNRRDDWYPLLVHSCLNVMSQFIRSYRFEQEAKRRTEQEQRRPEITEL